LPTYPLLVPPWQPKNCGRYAEGRGYEGSQSPSTLVNGSRQRVDLNRIGVWFADPLADDFCLGVNNAITPFDGDNAAGVQVFNSANAEPLPAP
jgi:hypothetical protein